MAKAVLIAYQPISYSIACMQQSIIFVSIGCEKLTLPVTAKVFMLDMTEVDDDEALEFASGQCDILYFLLPGQNM